MDHLKLTRILLLPVLALVFGARAVAQGSARNLQFRLSALMSICRRSSCVHPTSVSRRA